MAPATGEPMREARATNWKPRPARTLRGKRSELAGGAKEEREGGEDTPEFADACGERDERRGHDRHCSPHQDQHLPFSFSGEELALTPSPTRRPKHDTKRDRSTRRRRPKHGENHPAYERRDGYGNGQVSEFVGCDADAYAGEAGGGVENWELRDEGCECLGCEGMEGEGGVRRRSRL